MKLRAHYILALLVFGVTAVFSQGDKNFSLTMSPLHLALPVIELTGEYALSPKVGAAAIAGYGGIKETGISGNKINIPVLELGAQFNYYVIGSFHRGLQLGAELLWIKVSPPDQQGITVAANGAAAGPFVGYKWIWGSGFTLFLQGGYERLFAQAKAKDANGQEIQASVEDGIPLLNINLGWSF